MVKWKEWFKDLSPTMQIVVLVVVAVILYIIIKRLSGFLKGLGKKGEQQGQIDAYKASGQTPSFTTQQYKDKADQLYYWMKGISGAHSRSVIYQTLGEMNNDLDLSLLERAFGAPDGYDLKGWVRDEWFIDLDRINKGFAAKGIEKRY